MPSLLQRVRRGSDTPQGTPETPTHRKRASVDSQAPGSPSKGGFGKNVKSLFINDPQAGSLKKRLSLSSPSAIFNTRDKQPDPVSPTTLSSGPSSAPFTPNYSVALPEDATPSASASASRMSGTWERPDENQTRRLSQPPQAPTVAPTWPVMVPDSQPSQTSSERPSFSHDSGYGSVERNVDKPVGQPARPSPLSVDIPSSPFAPNFNGTSTPSPRSAVPRPFTRPSLSGRQSSFNVMSSPPMPRPIANLPTLAGPSAVPPSPGWGRTSAPSTPGGLGNFNSLFQNRVQQQQQVRSPELDEADVRKARRAMPVMLREPSVRPMPDTYEGGEAGDDDDDDDDDEESDIDQDGADDDSEDEEEQVNASPTPTPSRKGKGKAKPRMRANTMDAVREEDGPSSPPGSPKALADRRKLPSPHLGSLPPSPPASASTSTWAMPTPKGQKSQASWTQFQSMTPGATPKSASMVPLSSRSQTPRLLQTPGYDGRESYFGSSATTSTVHSPMLEEARPDHGEVENGIEAGSSAGSSDESPSQPVPPPKSASRPAHTPSRPSLYSRPSRSMVDLASPVEPAKTNKGPGMIEIPAPSPSTTALPTPGDWQKPPPTPAVGSGVTPFFARQRKDAASPIKRRRSMGDLHKPPPAYVIPDASSGFPQPREDEGREKLPKYWCGVHIEGSLTRKMEFSSPGNQSRDRSWKKHYFILHGTSLYVYKHDVHKFPVKRADGSLVPIPDVGLDESAEFLHVHHHTERRASLIAPPPQPVISQARRGSVADAGPRRASDGSGRVTTSPEPSTAGSRRSSVSAASASSSTDAKDAALFQAPPRAMSSGPVSTQTSQSSGSGVHLPFHSNALIKQYTLQNSESGLAADYVKKKNVVRVRAQGEQFLLQTEGAKDVVNWIEAFQAATNVALDLDTRPMPKIITLPRRRRRRRPDGQPLPPSDANPATTDTPEGNAAAVAAAEAAARASARDQMDAMLVEDQRAGT